MIQSHGRALRLGLVMASAAALSIGCANTTPADGDVRSDSQQLGVGNSLYVADVTDDTVKLFNANSGAFEGTVVSSTSAGLHGPRGLVIGAHNDLLVANQNVDQPFAGEVLTYDNKTGTALTAAVDHNNPQAPYAPRGIARRGGDIFIADMGEPGYTMAGAPAPNPWPAKVSRFNSSGAWVSDLQYAPFNQTCTDDGVCSQLSPRAVVFGPDGALYVSAMMFHSDANPNATAGQIIRFANGGNDAGTVFVDGDSCGGCGLARPEGLSFGPDGKLYVTSFRKDASDTDKILVFNANGSYDSKIDLYPAGGTRAFAQAVVFGPHGKLFVPIAGGGPDTGSVRRYDVSSKTFDTFVAAGGDLGAGWYLTFGKADSATFAY